MGYGDFQFFDIIIFAGIAAFLIFRLKKVLGKRTGFNKRKDNNLSLSKNSVDSVKNKDIPELSENVSELRKAYEVIEDFDHKNFLNGAKFAFETIINSFNKGDTQTLKSLLTEDVYKVFLKIINDKKNDPASQIFSLNIEKIESVTVDQLKIIIKVKFVSEQYKNNDENTRIKNEDMWSFEKLLTSKNPNWLLCST